MLIIIYSYRYGDAAIDDYIDIPDIATMPMGTQYSAPSTRANSESSLRYTQYIIKNFFGIINDDY